MSVINKIKKLNPEQNAITRSILYTIGTWGVIHLTFMAIFAVYERDIRELNTLVAVNADKFFPIIKESYIIFALSWIGLIYTIWQVKKRISKD